MPEPLLAPRVAWLAERARRDGARPALRFEGEDLTFAGLAARVAVLAACLRAAGVRPGDRLAVLMNAGARLVEIVHAAQWTGLTLVLVNTRLTAAEIAGILADADPALVLAEPALAARLPAGIRALVGAQLDATAIDRPLEPVALDPRSVFTILYTSGTTGRPKGAMLTHANHAASAAASRANLGIVDGDRWLVALPLHHVGGLSVLFRCVLDGVPLTVQAGFDPERVLAAIAAGGVTLTSMVATMLARLLDALGGSRCPGALRAVLLGGGPVPAALLERAWAQGIPALPTYGLTEAASQVTTASRGNARRSSASAGRPVAGTEVRIVGAGRDGVGEIAVRGPTVMAGYFRDAGATAHALRGGWLHTGDLGRIDAAGGLHVADRRCDLIVSGGENVYPAEVEAALLAHPAVLEAGVFAEPDPEWGQRVCAAVVLRGGARASAEDLRGFAARYLARFKVPRSIAFFDSLPRTSSGKLQRRRLATRERR
ncbi:MAG: o-succinylbenzoate--CoA ligase [Deltaproteobacteria bacterium]|nr:o-succinylbenzoate--CoA ligase [Deltaproteobacteria bacterium]